MNNDKLLIGFIVVLGLVALVGVFGPLVLLIIAGGLAVTGVCLVGWNSAAARRDFDRTMAREMPNAWACAKPIDEELGSLGKRMGIHSRQVLPQPGKEPYA